MAFGARLIVLTLVLTYWIVETRAMDGCGGEYGKNYWKCMIKDRSRRSLEDDPDVPKGCTTDYQDPFASGSKVACCAGLEQELKDWDGDGKYYYKCMAKETGNFKCWNQGCPDHGGALVKNCPECVDSMTCANWGHGIWLDCSDENRMI